MALDALAALPELVRMAEQLAAAMREELVLVRVGEASAAGDEAEQSIRRALSGRIATTVVEAGTHDGTAVSEAARQLGGGLVIAGFGGEVAPGEAEVAQLAAKLECPLLLLRSAPAPDQPAEEPAPAPHGGASRSRT